jgi:hypothetical protein
MQVQAWQMITQNQNIHPLNTMSTINLNNNQINPLNQLNTITPLNQLNTINPLNLIN